MPDRRRRTPVRDIIEVETQFYILATSALADNEHLVLKEGETFALFDRYGDIRPVGLREEGLYHEGTRFLSGLLLRIDQDRPLLLSSSVREDNALVTVDLTNPDIVQGDTLVTPRGALHLSRRTFLLDGVCHCQLRFFNYGQNPVSAKVGLLYGSDFIDIFEVRGSRRERRGERLDPIVDDRSALLGYRGLDGVERRTRITIDPAPAEITPDEAWLDIELNPGSEITYDVDFACERSPARPMRVGFEDGLTRVADKLEARRLSACEVFTANEQFNEWIVRSVADLAMMMTDTNDGVYPYAGVPWFSAPFGRDGLITALSCLWLNPDLARGVLRYLAAVQATANDNDADAQAGKILHECRGGEMAATGEIPFGRYYGSHDATPLFVMLAAAYLDRTGDDEFIDALWPHIEAALRWIEGPGDIDRDGFSDYLRQSPNGLVHQGWKDSHDAIFHSDGRLAEGPIALCEIQGYVYAAWRGAARMAIAREDHSLAAHLNAKADALADRFDRQFWSDQLGLYAIALDGEKRPCLVGASNAGHVLFAGLASHDRALRVAQTLLDEVHYSGWGIRTVARRQRRYNPMSYHNGSIWPHDNAIIAAGFARYGLQTEALKVFSGLFDASLFIPLRRLPELFCGFQRRPGEGPTMYPVACSPQSWAAASVFLLLQSVLGVNIHASTRRIVFQNPRLPSFLDSVRLSKLAIGDAWVDLLIERHGEGVTINVLRRHGAIEVVTVK